ncbi:receptor-like protein kinase 2 [Tanacetum coccineum]
MSKPKLVLLSSYSKPHISLLNLLLPTFLTAFFLASFSAVVSAGATAGRSASSNTWVLTMKQYFSQHGFMIQHHRVISGDLGSCRNLVTLDLSSNSLVGPIPSSIFTLEKLENLILNSNKLTGIIPPEIGTCLNLKNLHLYDNRLIGEIPSEIGNLLNLEVFRAGGNNDLAGKIPDEIGNCRNLTLIGLADTRISGSIPSSIAALEQIPVEIGNGNLEVFFAWENELEGSIPTSLGNCGSLQALDLSHNSLTGSIPPGLFMLQNLTKLLLISKVNYAWRFSVYSKSINISDLSEIRLFGVVPNENCKVLDVSVNHFNGPIPASLGRLVSLNKLILSQNEFSGAIPKSLELCSGLQFLDLSSNKLSGEIPPELGNIQTLEIALNLSRNGLTGSIPAQISALNKLSILDMSYNKLEGNLSPLSHLDNLVSLNISYNNFTGYLPDNKLFRQLSQGNLEGNRGLCSFGKDSCFLSNVAESGNGRDEYKSRNTKRLRLALALLITLTIAMMLMGLAAVLRARRDIKGDDESELGESWPWQFTPFQKLNISVERILKCLVDTNVIGKGCSGVVYRADMDNGDIIAVKKLWPSMTVQGAYDDEKSAVRDSFSAEVKTLGSVRHKNIVRFLGCCWNKKTRLLMYDYMPNGSLGSLLHERMGSSLEWELRYRILLGAAEGLAYLHHDCVPPIVHRDIKANNILIGMEFEPYIADFGLAKLVDDGDFARSSNTIAGSYGYIAPGTNLRF